jgi:hypothetical protein
MSGCIICESRKAVEPCRHNVQADGWRQVKVHGEWCRCREMNTPDSEPCHQIIAGFNISEITAATLNS